MVASSALLVTALSAGVTIAKPLYGPQAAAAPIDWQKSFQVPGPDDMRSPCPGLNVLANHGFINRNGMHLTAQAIGAAAKAVYNFESKPFENVANFAIKNLANVTSLPGTIDLNALRTHDVIEHDASLSRDDLSQGNNWKVNPALVEQLITLTPGDGLTFENFGYIRAVRNTQSQNLGNPPLTGRLLFGSQLEATLVMNVLGKEPSGNLVAPKNQVKVWFDEERLPDGYMPRQHTVGNLDFLSGANTVGRLTSQVKLSNAPANSVNNPNKPSGLGAVLANPLSIITKPFKAAGNAVKDIGQKLVPGAKQPQTPTAAAVAAANAAPDFHGSGYSGVSPAVMQATAMMHEVVDMEMLARGEYHDFTEAEMADKAKMYGILAMHGLPVRL